MTGHLALAALSVLVISCAPSNPKPQSNVILGRMPTASPPVPVPQKTESSPNLPRQQKKDNLLTVIPPNGAVSGGLRDLERAAKTFPEDGKAQARYGSALVEAGQVPLGISTLRRAVKLEPTLVAAWHNLAFAAEHQSWLDLAADAYAHVVAARPDMAGEWVKLGYVLLPLGRFDEAERAFNKAAVLQPGSSEVLVALASSEFAFFHYDKAVSNLKSAIALTPRSASEYANLASIEMERGNRELAETAAKTACSLEPDISRHYLLLAQILAESFRADKRIEAKIALQRVSFLGRNEGPTPLQISERAQFEYLLGLLANLDGNKNTALVHWHKSYALDRTQTTTLLALAHALLGRKGKESAEGSRLLDAYQRAQSLRDHARVVGQQAEMHPNDGQARFEYGKLLLAQNNLVHAVWELHEAVRLRPRDVIAKRLLAQTFRRVGRIDEAEALRK